MISRLTHSRRSLRLVTAIAIALPFGLLSERSQAQENKSVSVPSVLRQATEAAGQLERASLRIMFLCDIAIAYKDAGEAATAHEILEDALRAADRLEDTYEISGVAVSTARATLEIKAREEAQKILNRAVSHVVNLRLNEDSGHSDEDFGHSDQSYLLAQLAEEQFRCGDPFTARETLERAIRAAQQCTDAEKELHALDDCEQAALKVSLRETAQDTLARMKPVIQSLKDDRAKEQWLAKLSYRVAEIGDLDAALGILRTIMETHAFYGGAFSEILRYYSTDISKMRSNSDSFMNFVKSTNHPVQRAGLYLSLLGSGYIAVVPSGTILDELKELSRAQSLEGNRWVSEDIDWERARGFACVALSRATAGDRLGAEANFRVASRIMEPLKKISMHFWPLITQLARVKVRMNEVDAALELANVLNPEERRLDVYYAIAEELKKVGDLAGARKVLTTTFDRALQRGLAAKNDHDDMIIESFVYRLGELQASIGDYEGARRTHNALQDPPVSVTQGVAQLWTRAGHAEEALKWAAEQKSPELRAEALLSVAVELLGRRGEGLKTQ